MRGKRPIFINNSLVHGICNYNCRLCGVNKETYQGPKEYQPREVTQKLIERCREAAREGISIRYLENSGDGESTLHPEFAARMDDFGDMIRTWDNRRIPPPNVCVVSNGNITIKFIKGFNWILVWWLNVFYQITGRFWIYCFISNILVCGIHSFLSPRTGLQFVVMIKRSETLPGIL